MIGFLHYDYPAMHPEMGIYRHLVDFMAHSKLGNNTLVYIVDAIWSGRNWMGFVDKFGMAPFNNDYTSSIFISQDAVAIESVSFDFLYNEYAKYGNSNHSGESSPTMEGVQDYIHQAADPLSRLEEISYDPDHDDHSEPVGSLGVHEHWNNATKMEYSVNLTGEWGGIHLVTVPDSLVGSVSLQYSHENITQTAIRDIIHENLSLKVFPNPAHNHVYISYKLQENAFVTIELFTFDGKKLTTLLNKNERVGLQSSKIALNEPSGLYILKLTSKSKTKSNVLTSKLIVK
jgi:hypothetical protein